jgi:hypothetical protein
MLFKEAVYKDVTDIEKDTQMASKKHNEFLRELGLQLLA